MPLDKHTLQRLKDNDPSLTICNLHSNALRSADVAALVKALKVNRTLTTLILNDNALGEAGGAALADALKINCTLTTLYLSNNGLGIAGGIALAEALKVNCTLTSLILGANNLGGTGGTALAGALKVNHTLTSLNLHCNALGEVGGAALADALKINCTLTILNLSNNSLGGAGGAALADALKANRMLTTLDLCSNALGEVGSAALAEALQINQTLTTLELFVNEALSLYIDDTLNIAHVQDIETLLARNQALTKELLKAAKQGDLEQVKSLSQQGVSINAQDNDGNHALHVAVTQENYRLVQWLINQGANSQLENRQGKTAWQIAQGKPLVVLVDEIKPQQIPSLKGFSLFKIKQIQKNPDLLPEEQQQNFVEQVASLPEELKNRLG